MATLEQYEFWETLAYVFAAMALFGLFGGQIPEQTEWLKSLEWKRRLRFWGAILLVIGLAGDALTLGVITSRP